MKPEQFIREWGLPEAKRILERAPEDATHYRDLSCGTRYTKNVSDAECYVWTNKHWRRSVVPYQIFTSEVIKPLSDLKRLVESLDFINSVHGIDEAKELLREIDSEEWCYNLLTNVPIAVECAPSDDLVIHYAPLKQAIRDHESIYGGGDE
ncbi:hypothetical protein [Acinetobacter baumannii]|uniref:hypothetical protein n=1 Tax=Acinetobacter baumannii TaxID=470 RepID=UPI00396C33BA